MKKFLSIVAILLLIVLLAGCFPDKGPQNTPGAGTEHFEDYGLPVITVYLSKVTIKEGGLYISMKEVGAYLYLYHKLPDNFATKSVFDRDNVTAKNKLSTGGDVFYNREGLLPANKSYRECDIDYQGGSRNAKRIVFSVTDWTIFYTDDHYESFSILRFLP